MSLGMELRLRQHLAITPQIQQALRLLQLSSQEFTQEVEQAVTSNPFLEEDPDAPPPGPAAAMPLAPAASSSEPRAETVDGGDSEGSDAPVSPALHEIGRSGGGGGGDEEHDWTEWTEAPISLRDNLRNQLLLSPMSDRDRTLAHMVIDELTDAGYLETPLEELADLISPEEEVDVHELSAALKLVQQLDPPGIAARSLQECLLLQLQALPASTPNLPLALELVGQHFELLARREFTRLQQLLSCDENALHGARALIRTLDPRPGRSFAPDNTRYVVPDIIVTNQRGRWVATLNPAVQPQVRINRAYAEIAASRSGCGASFSRLLQEARWLLRNVEQRFNTIQRVADAIVARQRVFFSYGEAAMKPMALKDIATELGLHESTVCRVTNGKYMATPRGLFEFKYFFSRQLATDDGGSCSATAIRALLKELIAAEDPQAPLSDAQLARMLAEQGLRLARRTVTKYRTLMRVPSVELRRVAGRAPNAAEAGA
ncbi:RNA polymerase sigma-54 factor [Azoarcus olearius]|uniref:RNA polymerase factor sigma-54 n=1 Tax=Azoarcus sp. (strain BH72) TaxID=418699 RepID=UPI0008063F6F|nr:RNA polymerase factor sigma-54 [Azoarcus olearius]ANQ84977.1 RNA polymerase sigma-54 factor [Azoarcus olearius]